jgi:hypothetical protein
LASADPSFLIAYAMEIFVPSVIEFALARDQLSVKEKIDPVNIVVMPGLEQVCPGRSAA